LAHRSLFRTHELYICKDAAHAFIDRIRDRYRKQQQLTGSVKTPSDAFQLSDANAAVETFVSLRKTKAGRHIIWKKKRRTQYGVTFPLARAIREVRVRDPFGAEDTSVWL
jgi:hypothetical protein